MVKFSLFSKFIVYIVLFCIVYQQNLVFCSEEDEERPCPRCEPMLDIEHWEAEHIHQNGTKWKGRANKRQTSPAVIYHGGPVLNSVSSSAIFWGQKWATASYVQDKITAVDSFLMGVGGSHYASVDDQYTGSNGAVTSSIHYNGHYIDLSTASAVLQGSTPLYNAIKATVCRNVLYPDPSGNGFYPVFTDIPRPTGSGYCAWHSSDYCNGKRVQFGFFWSLDGDGGCDVRDTSGLHSQGAGSIVNVVAHELNEARTDPVFSAWLDATGYETADKCAWHYSPVNSGLVTLTNGARFKLQGEWSNSAFSTKTGFNDGSGNLGCSV